MTGTCQKRNIPKLPTCRNFGITSLLLILSVFLLELSERAHIEPLPDELPDIGSPIIGFAANHHERELFLGSQSLQCTGADPEQQAQILIVQQLVTRHYFGVVLQRPYTFAHFFLLVEQFLHPLFKLIVFYIHIRFIFQVIHK